MDIKKTVLRVVSVVFGLILMLNGLNYYLHFYSLPDMAPGATHLVGAIAGTGYLMHLVKAIEIGAGLCLVVNRLVPLSLVVLAPVVVNIFLLHAVLDTKGLPVAAFLLICQLVLLWAYRNYYRPMATLEAEPDLGDSWRMGSGKLAGQSA